MSVSASALVGRPRPGRWSIAAFVLSTIGLAASVWVVFGSDGDPAGVRWWLVAAPVLVTAVPLVLADHRVRIAAVIALGGWCVLTGFSIGYLLLPAFGALLGAVLREDG